jgi:hypothetical protein
VVGAVPGPSGHLVVDGWARKMTGWNWQGIKWIVGRRYPIEMGGMMR